MILDDYKCGNCGRIQEVLSEDAGSRPPEEKCEKCGGPATRIFSLGTGGQASTIIGENAGWLANPDPRHPDSPNRNLVNPHNPEEMANLPRTRSERAALMKKKGLFCFGDGDCGADRRSDEVYSGPL